MNRDGFWVKVDSFSSPDGCWQWMASTRRGYGQFCVDGRRLGAHRVAWTLENGPIPEGKCVLHRCDNRRCVRPAHLFVGTKLENTRDMWAKDRGSRHGRPTPGMRHPLATLTDDNVREIRRLAAGGMPLPELCTRFNYPSTGTMSAIVRRKRWAHVE